jgi:hypothetical protein
VLVLVEVFTYIIDVAGVMWWRRWYSSTSRILVLATPSLHFILLALLHVTLSLSLCVYHTLLLRAHS